MKHSTRFPYIFIAIILFSSCKKIYDFSTGINTDEMIDSYRGVYGLVESYPIKKSIWPYGKEVFTEIRYSKDKDYYYLLMLNPTDSTISFKSEDGQPRMIQEAKDNDGNWKPIEYWSLSTCGNSHWTYRLESNYKVYYRIRKYKGTILTKLRVKYLMNGEIQYSPSYWGFINPNQFIKPDGLFARQFLE